MVFNRNIMKKLILVRHAKSSWKENVIDHERPLLDRGINDAKLVSNTFKNLNYKPDVIISSDAFRAKYTARIFKEALNFPENKFQLLHDLYDFSGELLLNVIKSCSDEINTLMLFGHNHALTSFVNTYGDKHIDNVPTSGLVVINFNTNHWQDLSKGITDYVLFPRDLK